MSYNQILNRHMLKGLFPHTFKHVKFAFIGEHIDRYDSIIKAVSFLALNFLMCMALLISIYFQKRKPVFDIIMAVDDVLTFHKKNLLDNKEHYTYFVRLLKGKPALWLHRFGAKMLFNTISVNEKSM